MTKNKIDWTRSELFYLDMGTLPEEFEQEIYIYHDGDAWVIIEAHFDGARAGHYCDENGMPFVDIEVAREYAEKMIAKYQEEWVKAK